MTALTTRPRLLGKEKSPSYQVLLLVRQPALLDDEPVKPELDGGALHDLLVHRVLRNQAEDANLAGQRQQNFNSNFYLEPGLVQGLRCGFLKLLTQIDNFPLID